MNQRHLMGLLLRPSVSSAIFTLVVAGAILIGSSWSVISGYDFFYSYFSGPNGLITILHESPNSAAAFIDGLFAQSVAYNILVLVFAAIVGLAVYGLLRLVSLILENILGGALQWQVAKHQPKGDLEKSIKTKTSARLVVLLVWAVYILCFANLILPFCILSFYDFTASLSYEAVLQRLLGFVTLVLSLHVHVIFARLFTLRPRLFGERIR